MTPSEPSAHSPVTWFTVGAALVLMMCICGLAGGAILVSAGVAAYRGFSNVGGGPSVVTVAAVVVPSELPPPTFTFQPTYTPLPTYTLAPTPLPATETPVVIVVTATPPAQAVATTGASTPAVVLTEDVSHEVQAGESVEAIAAQYGMDVIPLVYVNGLDPDDPQISTGDELTVPADLSEWCVPANEPVQAEVVSVVDGNTIEVSIGGQNFRVRYIGIDAPDVGANAEPFAAESLNANLDLVDGQTVTLFEDITNAGNNNELPRYVLVDNVFVNYELARRGYAEAVPADPDVSCDDLFALAAGQAEVEGLGLWASTGQAAQPGQTSTPGAATSTPPASAWTPPPTLTATSTSSLAFSCHCWGNQYAWGNFSNQAEADACEAICQIAADRKAATCATAAASAGSSPGLFGCK